MKTLLYITCHSKPEELSASKTVARELLNSILAKNTDITVKELDIYEMKLPELRYEYFQGRNSVVSMGEYDKLTKNQKKDVDTIKNLATEFKNADYYIVVAPMWSLLFPAALKKYLDCIIQKDITIKMEKDNIGGLLNDKKRVLFYVQSSGGPIPWLIERKINHGGIYLKDIFRFLGIKHIHEILVDKTGFTAEEQHKAIQQGHKEARNKADVLS
ncbi:NAD(P)H-dependent oxidoreductase [Clostridium sp. 'deep sea']|uniref:FMN-dependent NADH-azoreductase n=1 Tax=Clostridium sp. 'deep sea' TaxID=2779445 RepID=UPI0018966D8C|nr:NAD(P)H-dependent oxidoreductase [Clostridium sp. 'deep sea']QOR35017.1 NAD(P)H-dependent oxidoreductase [Clostridium sp. 'deep sea']